MTAKHWLALGVVGSGVTSLMAMALFAKGRREEGLALAFTAGVLSTTFAAARVLSADASAESLAPKPTQPGDAAGYSMAGLLGVRAVARVAR